MDDHYRPEMLAVYLVLCSVASLAIGVAYLAWFQ